MPVTVLRLEYASLAQGNTDALFVPGTDAPMWLKEISSWPVDHDGLKLLVVPQGKSNLSSGGVLVLGEAIADVAKVASPSVVEFTCRASRLFLPVNSELAPSIDDTELAETLPLDGLCVWHPLSGFTIWSPDEVLSVADLFDRPAVKTMEFHTAMPGTAFNRRLHSLTLHLPEDVSADDILGDGKGDIGEEVTSLDQLKPIPSERDAKGIRNAMNLIASPFAKIAKTLADKIPASGNERTWINGVEDWANRVLENLNQRAQQRQFLEIYRLQKMLEDNPDEGLKYAMPLSSAFSNSLASAGSWLSRRLVNFNLSGLGGGGAAGPGLPYDLHSQLMKRYRELAEREIHLGRYRRAAYIYGNLLNDIHSAAKTLETGKHYREAAILFQKKLNRNDDAARCLKAGGYFGDAIELYESLGRFETAGDLYAELDLVDNARESWQTAIERHRKSGDLLETARIEENKLLDSEAALTTLAASWPSTHQTALCVQHTFRILAKGGLHQRSRNWIAKIESEAQSVPAFLQLVELLSKTATTYPDQTTRNFAENVTLQMVSRSLTTTSKDSSQLLGAVARLQPSDTLLRRDCNRFQPHVSKVSLSIKPRSTVKEITLYESHWLSERYRWESAIGLRGGFLVAGRPKDPGSDESSYVALKCLSSDFSQSSDTVVASSNNAQRKHGVVVLAANSSRNLAIAHGAFDAEFKSQIFASPENPARAYTRSLAINEDTCSICAGPRNQWVSLRDFEEHWILEYIDESGAIVSSRLVHRYEDPEGYGMVLRPPMWCDGTNTWITLANALIQVTPQSVKTITFQESLGDIAGSVHGGATRIAVSFSNGFRVLWPDWEMTAPLISQDMQDPKLLFTQTGHLVVVSGKRCEVYHTRKNQTQLVGTINVPECRSLFRTDDSSQFGMLDESGQILIFRIPLG